MIRNTPYGKRIQSKIQRETSDHMSRSAYHPALVPGGYNGHFINPMNAPHQFMHPGQHMMGQMGGDFGRQQQGFGGHHMGGQHLQHHQNGAMAGQHQQFAPFQQQGIPSMGLQQDYQSNGYAPFM